MQTFCRTGCNQFFSYDLKCFLYLFLVVKLSVVDEGVKTLAVVVPLHLREAGLDAVELWGVGNVDNLLYVKLCIGGLDLVF